MSDRLIHEIALHLLVLCFRDLALRISFFQMIKRRLAVVVRIGIVMSRRAMNAPRNQADNTSPEQSASCKHRPSSIESVPHSEYLLVMTRAILAPPLDGIVRIRWEFGVNAERGGAQGVDIDGQLPTIEGVMPTIEGHTPTKTLLGTLFPRARIAVLSELSKAADTGLHLREIARRSDLNSKTVLREVHALRNVGVLTAQKIGRQIIYRLSPDCPIYEELRSIIRKTVGLAGVLRDVLAPVQDRIELAYVYGSHATGTERSDSDVDLMVVGDIGLRELSSPIREAGRTMQRTVNPTLYSSSEYAEELKDDNSFVARVHHGARINLIGGES